MSTFKTFGLEVSNALVAKKKAVIFGAGFLLLDNLNSTDARA
jgi:hypothetical protein